MAIYSGTTYWTWWFSIVFGVCLPEGNVYKKMWKSHGETRSENDLFQMQGEVHIELGLRRLPIPIVQHVELAFTSIKRSTHSSKTSFT